MLMAHRCPITLAGDIQMGGVAIVGGGQMAATHKRLLHVTHDDISLPQWNCGVVQIVTSQPAR
jgi:hypothetical protein